MIALAVACLLAGAAAGVILMGMVTAGRREDECRDCRRALPAEPEWRDGTDD